MTRQPPHTTLMMLHRLVDRALTPLVEPMGLRHATESYSDVDRSALVALTAASSTPPQGLLATFGTRSLPPGIMIAEPALCSTILARLWRADRDPHAPMTHVEGEILRQFLGKVMGQWRAAWAAEDVHALPTLTLASSLDALLDQIVGGTWHVARTVVRDETGAAAGVLLFCYPAAVLPALESDAGRIRWRARIDRGLTDRERELLHGKLSTSLRDVIVSAPVSIVQRMSLGTLDALERGDIIEFDADAHGNVSLSALDRTVTGTLARHGERLALALTGPAPANPAAPEIPPAPEPPRGESA